MGPSVSEVLDRISWMEWDEKLAVLEGLVDCLGVETIWHHLKNRPSESIIAGLSFLNSNQYWDDRYLIGGNSGAGSYDRLAQFKADVLNKFAYDRDVSSVIEFGCGDG